MLNVARSENLSCLYISLHEQKSQDWDIAQLVECLCRVHQPLSSVPHHKVRHSISQNL